MEKSTHDKCMYCGAEIPVDLRLSEEQKNEIIEKQQEELDKQMSTNSPSSLDKDDSIISTSITTSSDISGVTDCG